jgi:hypothetical protein
MPIEYVKMVRDIVKYARKHGKILKNDAKCLDAGDDVREDGFCLRKLGEGARI